MRGGFAREAPLAALPEQASMAENKTKPTDASVEDYIASRANEEQRDS